jgi:hypothetical protein
LAFGASTAVSGVLSGLLGIGGGFVIVPSLTRYTNMAVRSIFATSFAVIALVWIGGVSAATWQGTIAWHIALPFALGAIFALLAGRLIAARLAGARLQQGFAITSSVVSVLLLARGLGLIAGQRGILAGSGVPGTVEQRPRLAARPNSRELEANTGHWPILHSPAQSQQAVPGWLA